MSTEESLDPSLIEQTKHQIRSLVNEIAQLAKEDVAPEQFYGEFLPRVVSALAANGGAVWTVNEDGRLALQYQMNLQQTNLRDNEEGQQQHGRLLYKCLSGGEGMLVPPHSGAGEGEDDPAANPTDFLLVLGPLKTNLEVVGVLEIFQRSEAGSNTQRGYLRFLMQMCELAGDYLKSHQLQHFSDRQALWSRLEDFTHNVHTALEPRETAYTIANEGRRLIECDRVSVAIRRGNRCKVESVSGQDLFDKRSNTIRLLGRLATAVVRSGDPVWYTGDTTDMPPQVEDAVQDYVDESHSKNVAVLPLTRPQLEEEDDPKKRTGPEEPIGALIVEQIEDSRVPESMKQRVDIVCRHSSTALANSLEHNDLFLMPLWRLLGKTKWILRARTLPKTLTIAGIVLALLLGLFFWPADFELESKGSLEPEIRRDIFARTDGVVDDIYVRHGDYVYPQEIKQAALAAAGALLTAETVTVDDALLGRISTALVDAGAYEQTAEEVTDQLRAKYNGVAGARNDVLAVVDAHLKTLLVSLRSEELDIAIEGVVGKMEATRRKKEEVLRQLRSSRLSEVEKESLGGELPVLRAQLDSLQNQWNLYREKEQDLQISAPIRGQIVTWDLYDRLVHRPVQRGQVLMQVAEPEGVWQLELEMGENRMGHIVRAHQALCADLREQLREYLLKKDTALSEEEAKRLVAQVPDGQLAEELRRAAPQELQTEMSEALTELAGEAADEAVGSALQELAGKESYAEMHSGLEALLGTVPVDDFRSELSALLDDGLDDRLLTTYILATDPSVEFLGRVKEIHQRAEVRGDEGNTVLIKVAIDEHELPDLRPGATVTAKVYCGRRSIGYVWFHDAIAFVQSRILFRFF